MKRRLETGKLWIILSIFLFIMTCGIFVARASMSSNKFYAGYNAEIMGNTLTTSGWNSVMEGLDEVIPDGAIVPFLSDVCPEGWNELTGSEGKFLMGASSNIRRAWEGSNILTEVPAHQHKLKYRNRVKATDNADTIGYLVNWDDDELPDNVRAPGSWENNGNTYNISTSTVGNVSGVDITNKYVKVRFCVKGNYNIKIDYCEGGYNKSMPTCNLSNWKELMSTSSHYGSFTCYKCKELTCEEYSERHGLTIQNQWMDCDVENLAPGIAKTTNENDGTMCVVKDCCIEAEGAVEFDNKCMSLYNR